MQAKYLLKYLFHIYFLIYQTHNKRFQIDGHIFVSFYAAFSRALKAKAIR